MTDSIQTVVKATSAPEMQSPSVWMYVALAELICILVLLVKLCFYHKKKTEHEQLKRKVMQEGDIDFANVINSSFKAKELYDELKGKCHPDKFTKDATLNVRATEIFSLLVRNKYNYKALCELKERAQNELGINI